MRLFIGIDLPAEIKSKIELTLYPLQLSSKGWEHPHDYHQTLLFIGEIEKDRVDEIKARMNNINYHSFELSTNGISFFNRRIMFVDFIASEELMRLKEKIDHEFSEYIRSNEKSFVPHITVKRWQRYEYKTLSEGILKYNLPLLKFRVTALSLFKSERDSHNFKYHVIHQRILASQ